MSKLLGKRVSRGSWLAMLGGMVAKSWLSRKRKEWSDTGTDGEGEHLEAMLDKITAYDIGRGSGKLLAGWYRAQSQEVDLDAVEQQLQALLGVMDHEDETHFDRARSRYLISKTLFYLEGFRLGHCRYEKYQTEARDLLRRNPDWKQVARGDVFLGKPFQPELLIGTLHRMLFSLESPGLYAYLADVLDKGPLRDDVDYMSRLLAATFGHQEDGDLALAIEQWFREYREFKIQQTYRQEKTITTSLDIASTGLSGLGPTLADRLLRMVMKRLKPSSP